MNEEQAHEIAREWIDAWSSHELDRILAHYDDDVVLTSPLAVERLRDPTGTVRGKAALRAYFGEDHPRRRELRCYQRSYLMTTPWQNGVAVPATSHG